jgi:hypothetical protein
VLATHRPYQSRRRPGAGNAHVGIDATGSPHIPAPQEPVTAVAGYGKTLIHTLAPVSRGRAALARFPGLRPAAVRSRPGAPGRCPRQTEPSRKASKHCCRRTRARSVLRRWSRTADGICAHRCGQRAPESRGVLSHRGELLRAKRKNLDPAAAFTAAVPGLGERGMVAAPDGPGPLRMAALHPSRPSMDVPGRMRPFASVRESCRPRGSERPKEGPFRPGAPLARRSTGR